MSDSNAFPSFWPSSTASNVHEISLRDYFAAAALQGLCAASKETGWSTMAIAKSAYACADAMLKERDK